MTRYGTRVICGLILPKKQIDKVVGIVSSGKVCHKIRVSNFFCERNVLETPSGMKLYGDHNKVFNDVKELLDGCSEKRATEFLFDLYNSNFITCGEYRVLYDWISEHTDGNGAVLKNW